MDDIQKLYNDLISEGLFTKERTSFDKFKSILSDDTKRNTLRDDLVNEGLFSKEKAATLFDTKFNLSPKSRWSIQDLTPQKLYEELPTPYQFIKEEYAAQKKQYKDRSVAYKKVNETISKSRQARITSTGHTNAYYAGEVMMPTFETKWTGKSRQEAAAEVLKTMPDFVVKATPEDIQVAIYGESYVKGRKEMSKKLAVKQQKHKEEYDKILGRDDIETDGDNLLERGAAMWLTNPTNWLGNIAFNPQLIQEENLQNKKQAAAYELYEINRKSAELSDYLSITNNTSKQLKDKVRREVKELGLDYDAYLNVNNIIQSGGKVSADALQEAQQVEEILKASETYGKYVELTNKRYGIQTELKNLPVIYKQGALVSKLENEVQAKFDKDYEGLDANTDKTFGAVKTRDLLKAVTFINGTFIGGIERNFITRPLNTITGIAALTGWDAAEVKAMENSYASQGGDTGRKASRFSRPTHEKVGTVKFRGEDIEVGFDSNGQISGVYNKYGDKWNPKELIGDETEDNVREALEEAIKDQAVFKTAEWDMNWGSIGANTLDLMMDIGATTLYVAGFSKALQAAGAAAAEAANLGKVSKLLTNASKSERLLEFVPMYAQYYGEGVMNAIRSGELLPQEAALFSVITTAAEAGSEALPFPMIGKLVRGNNAVGDAVKAITRGDVLGVLGRLPTRTAAKEAILSTLSSSLYEFGEEVGMELATPALNTIANSILDGKFTDTQLPTLRDLRDLGIMTIASSIIPATMTGISKYDYIKNGGFFSSALLKVADPKNNEFVDEFLKEMVGLNKLTQEEANKFKDLRNDLSKDFISLTTQGANNKASHILQSDIMGLKAYIYLEGQKLGTNEELNKHIQANIDAAQKKLDANIKKLQDIPSEDVQSGGLPVENATDNRTDKEAAGEGSLNLSQKENPLNLDVQSLPKDIAGRKEAIKTKLKNDGILVIEDENGNPC